MGPRGPAYLSASRIRRPTPKAKLASLPVLRCVPPHPISRMQGRVKRKLSLQAEQARAERADAAEQPVCALCQRLLGTRVEWHHRVPKSEGGNETVPVHPICHRTIHAHVSNHELAGPYADLELLRSREDMQRFLRWIAKKPADFHAPTRRSQADR